ncbi:zinc finger CCCH domain-containing protein 18-like isoform X2 [Phymastichus coffea]|uniref:zinc finger CCCH domain-containing protein 18-like isoform X2 n=1 Tax=Phymastichus coffea TaxID=108790 RepID=UPI00273A9367|nr:zinc finger CCCH domain-containing protein 18-like isoform X2 [Phymastichus coffea]
MSDSESDGSAAKSYSSRSRSSSPARFANRRPVTPPDDEGPASPSSDNAYPDSPSLNGPTSPNLESGPASPNPDSGPASPNPESDEEEHTCQHSPRNYTESPERDGSYCDSDAGNRRSTPASPSPACPHADEPASPKSYVSGPTTPASRPSGSRHSTPPRSPTGSPPSSPRSNSPPVNRKPPHSPSPSANHASDSEEEKHEDLSDVSDLESGDEEHHRNRKPKTSTNGPSNQEASPSPKDEASAASAHLTEETEQLDFEADGQWKDVKEDGDGDTKKVDKEMSESPKGKESGEIQEKVKDKKSKKKDKDEKKNKKKHKESREAGEIRDKDDAKEDGEKAESELEEGELSDGDEARPEETEPRPVCRFYNRGQCTWGVSCRFLHPGVTDKGNYTMFDMVRPMAYPPPHPPREFHPHIERPPMARPPPPGYGPPPHHPAAKTVSDDPSSESAWERGLRHAKEIHSRRPAKWKGQQILKKLIMMRKANKRKESDMDFEEKKMNLGLGQDELEREAGYYVRPASPEPPVERWPPTREAPPLRRGAPRTTPDSYADEEPYYHAGPEYYSRKIHYRDSRPAGGGGGEYRERMDYRMVSSRGTPHSISPSPHPPDEREYYHRTTSAKYEKKHKRPSREVIVERIPSSKAWREEEVPPIERGRGDEWADPWMRRKSPTSRRRHSSRRSRKQSYSSGSSYSSSSSSRSSSRTSYSSYESDPRSRSPSPPSRSRGKKIPVSPPSHAHRAAMLMNPPAPTPRSGSKHGASPSSVLHRRALNPPAPSPLAGHLKQREKKAALAAAAVAKVIKSHSRSRLLQEIGVVSQKNTLLGAYLSELEAGSDKQSNTSSGSSSGSDSSGSSSDSSDSSYSSSSSADVRRRKGSPPTTRKELKIKKIKGSATAAAVAAAAVAAAKKSSIAGKKRAAESPPSANASKKANNRREELLKQLKAVEDAIARKRSRV